MKIATDSVPDIVECDCKRRPYKWTVPAIRAREIHVWSQSTRLATDSVESFRSLLSVDEQERAQRFRFEAGRNEYVVSRGTLRVLLAAYQGTAAGRLQFAYSEYGRPTLARPANSERIEFNLSHCSGVTLLAFSRKHRIGVDLEEVRRDFEPLEISENFFSQSERAVLRNLPPDLRHEAFFRCWTRKEAFIKALGEGLSHPLDAFDVSLSPGAPAVLLATRPNRHEAERWTLRDLAVPEGYVAALAVELQPAPG